MFVTTIIIHVPQKNKKGQETPALIFYNICHCPPNSRLKSRVCGGYIIKPADVASVVHAYWYIVEYEYLICSECEGQYHTGCETTPEAEKMLEEGLYPSYCPHCGAKMDKPVPKKSRRINIHSQ